MRTKNKLILLIIVFFSFIVGCEKSPNAPEYQKEITVYGYLWGNERLSAEHAIMIAYTQPITEKYEMENAAINAADVTITEAGTERTFNLSDTSEKPGFYFNDSLYIQVNETYNLRVEVDGKVVTTSTTVPSNLKISTELDSISEAYRENLSREKPIFLQCESPEQIVLVDMYCNESYKDAEYVNQFMGHTHPNDQEEYDSGNNGEPRHIFAMAKLEEFTSPNYPGQNVVDWYSSMIVFYGSHTMQIIAIDDNYHRFLYTEHPEYSGGINNGLGVFGSVCGKTFHLTVLKPS